MAEMGNMVRILQLVTAILGLVFACSGQQITGLIVIFAIAVAYLVLIFCCLLTGRGGFSSGVQTIFEVALGIAVLGFAIYVCTAYTLGTLGILSVVCGFILPALLFLSSYERM